MIEIKDLSKSFGDVHAVSSLSLTISSGIAGLIGENGAGKSTLLRLIASIYKPDEGRITVDGFDASSQEAKAKIFLLPDDPYVPKGAQAKQVYDLYNSLYDVDLKKFYNLLDRFQLPKDRNVYTFSKGMRRQLIISLAMSVNVPYLFLDEAFDGIDPLTVGLVRELLIQEASEGKSIVVASHNISSLNAIADRFIMISKGRLGEIGSTSDMAKTIFKYQMALKKPLEEQELLDAGVKVILFHHVGSIIQIVCDGDGGEELEKLVNEHEPIIFEPVPVSDEEVIEAKMRMYRGRAE